MKVQIYMSLVSSFLWGQVTLGQYNLTISEDAVQESRQHSKESRDYDDKWDRPNLPIVKVFDVKCEKTGMYVHVEFTKPFYGIIFSKGFYNVPRCKYVYKENKDSFNFMIPLDFCGTIGEDHSREYKDSYNENTIIIQFDEYIQEVWDLSKKIRCEWNALYEKTVGVRPYYVDLRDAIPYRFNGDNIGCWMQIQKGKGPWADEVSGIVKVGDTMTLVIAVNDPTGKFDMHIKECVGTDGKGHEIQLTDYYGCVVQGKIITPFEKIKNYGSHASVLSFAHFRAFKFPDNVEIGIKCNIQICLHECSPQCGHKEYNQGSQYHHEEPLQNSADYSFNPYRRKRSDEKKNSETLNDGKLELFKAFKAISLSDINLPFSEQLNATVVYTGRRFDDSVICMSIPGFTGGVIVILLGLIITVLVTAFMCYRIRSYNEFKDIDLKGHDNLQYAYSVNSSPEEVQSTKE